MTRGLYPPETLSQDDVRTLAQIRKDIWYNSMIGGGFGAGSGFLLHSGAVWARRFGWFQNQKSFKPLNRNTLMLSVLGGGAFGMFLFALSAGKERVHTLHPIFEVGATPPPRGDLDRPDYRSIVSQATRASTTVDSATTEVQGENPQDEAAIVDMEKLRQMRLTRRRSLLDRLENGQGLNDAHGGQWYKENNRK